MDADPTGTSIISSLLLLLFFTLMNAFFAGAEMAVVSVNKNRIRSLAEDGNKKAKGHREAFRRFDEVSLDDSGGHHLCRLLFVGICCRAHCAGAGCVAGEPRPALCRSHRLQRCHAATHVLQPRLW